MTQNRDENDDLRVRRTRKTLQEALIALTVEKGFAAITVRDITERAMVNRSTFYRHYLDKYDLLEKYMNEVYAMVWETNWSTERRVESTGQPPPGLINLLTHIQQFGAFYRAMLGQKGDPAFTEHFRRNIETRFRFVIENYGSNSDPNGPPVDLKIRYISYADVGAILWWLESDQPYSVLEVATWMSQLTTASAGLTSHSIK